MVGLTFLDLGAENGASSAPPALQEFFRGARQFFPGPPNFSPSMLCGSNFLQHFPQNGDTPQSPFRLSPFIFPFPFLFPLEPQHSAIHIYTAFEAVRPKRAPRTAAETPPPAPRLKHRRRNRHRNSARGLHKTYEAARPKQAPKQLRTSPYTQRGGIISQLRESSPQPLATGIPCATGSSPTFTLLRHHH